MPPKHEVSSLAYFVKIVATANLKEVLDAFLP